jgi:hypothetical protein
MNAERLHAIVVALRGEIEERDVVKKMEAMVKALRSLSQQANPSNQQNLAATLKDFYEAVTDTNSDTFSPAWRQILSEIGGSALFGAKLKETVETVIGRNQMTPAVGLEELEKVLTSLEEFSTALDNGASSLNALRIGHEQLAPGECEIGLLIPRRAVKNQLLGLAEELQEIGFILRTFSEVATGKPDDLAIKTISSSDLLVYLQAGIPYATCVAVAIERIVELYKKLLEIRKLRLEMEKLGVPEKNVAEVGEFANKLMEEGIAKVSLEIMQKHHRGKDGERKNELANAVTVSLNMIANRIDAGYNMEVRVEPLAKGEESSTKEETKQAVATILAASSRMEFLKLEGPPVLRLPEGKEKTKKKG